MSARVRVSPHPRQRAGTYEVFARRYGPLEALDGGIVRAWDDTEVLQAFDSECFDFVWTLVEGDSGGKLYLVPGFATVNYVGRVLCERPWPDSELLAPGYLY
jgi:hypothetical protein